MANKFVNVAFYNSNILAPFGAQWTLSSWAAVVGSSLQLAAGAYASYVLSKDYIFSSFERCRYRKLNVTLASATAIGNEDAFKSNSSGITVTVDLTYTGVGALGGRKQDKRVFTLSKEMAAYSDGDSNTQFEFKYEASNMNISDEFNSVVTIKNNTSDTVTIDSIGFFRSNDSTQLGENATWQMQLSNVKAYLDGMEITFSESSAPVKIWYSEDANGNFDGINVNNERFISFSKVNGSLPG